MNIVVKFGGTSVGTAELVKSAAQHIKKLTKGNQVTVVVSAMGNQTSELLSLLKQVNSTTTDIARISEIIGMGEVISARLMAAALCGMDVPAVAVTPDSEYWPIYAEQYADRTIVADKINQEGIAAINLDRTCNECTARIQPLLKKNIVPVVCGFLAKDAENRLIAIGRGGSDITATLMGRCLNSDKVFIVTDVSGILSGDPKMVKADTYLKKITVKEIEHLSRGGARVIHPTALQFKLPSQQVYIVNYKSDDLLKGGTEIVGYMSAQVEKTEEKLAFITLVGEKFLSTSGLLNKITEVLGKEKISIYGLTISGSYFGIYIREDCADKAYNAVYGLIPEEPRFKAVSIRKGIARLCITSPNFIEEPGIIGRIGDFMALNSVNILEMNTIQSDITIFVNEADSEKVHNLLVRFTF